MEGVKRIALLKSPVRTVRDADAAIRTILATAMVMKVKVQ